MISSVRVVGMRLKSALLTKVKDAKDRETKETLEDFEVGWIELRDEDFAHKSLFLLTPQDIRNAQTELTKPERKGEEDAENAYITIDGYTFSGPSLTRVTRNRIQKSAPNLIKGLPELQKIQRSFLIGIGELYAQGIIQTQNFDKVMVGMKQGNALIGFTGANSEGRVTWNSIQFGSNKGLLTQYVVSAKQLMFNRFGHALMTNKMRLLNSKGQDKEAAKWFNFMQIDPDKVFVKQRNKKDLKEDEPIWIMTSKPSDFAGQFYARFYGAGMKRNFMTSLQANAQILQSKLPEGDPKRLTAIKWFEDYGRFPSGEMLNPYKIKLNSKGKLLRKGKRLVEEEAFDKAFTKYLTIPAILRNYMFNTSLRNLSDAAKKIDTAVHQKQDKYEELTDLLDEYDNLPRFQRGTLKEFESLDSFTKQQNETGKLVEKIRLLIEFDPERDIGYKGQEVVSEARQLARQWRDHNDFEEFIADLDAIASDFTEKDNYLFESGSFTPPKDESSHWVGSVLHG